MRRISLFDLTKAENGLGARRLGYVIIPGPGPDEFTGTAKVSTRDLQDNEIGTSETRLEGKRIEVESF